MGDSLRGKVAIVTGGSRGIGAAIVQRLAKEGASVAFSYGKSKQEAEVLSARAKEYGTNVEGFKADQAVPSEIRTFIAKVHEIFGRVDILVNNAGAFLTSTVDDPDADIDALDHLFNVNVRGVATAVRATVPLLPSGGRIITIGSAYADKVPYPGLGDYAASKSALSGYTRGWARDLGAKDITVNLVQPGPIDTDMNPASVPFADMLKKLVPQGRYGLPEDIAATVAFLASPEAGFVTGSTFNTDGGLNA